MKILKELDSYSINDLYEIRNAVSTLITKKEDQDTTPLWIVEDLWNTHAAFREEEFQEAAKKMSELSLAQAKEKPDEDLDLSIRKMNVRNSEVEKYLAKGKNET